MSYQSKLFEHTKQTIVDAVCFSSTRLNNFKLEHLPFSFGNAKGMERIELLKKMSMLRKEHVLIPKCDEETDHLFWWFRHKDGAMQKVVAGDWLVFFQDGTYQVMNEAIFQSAFMPINTKVH